jgi:sialidase-1
MKKTIKPIVSSTGILAFFLLFGVMLTLNAQQENSSRKIATTLWKGFDRQDFALGERVVRIVLPKKPAAGNPWLWRARFPDYNTEADSILVSEGFHLVYINTDNEYGGPSAMKAWDNLYDYVTKEYKLNKKVALVGVSRGGLFVYSWAKRNPEKVASIYGDVPVCDFKSWPMGKNGKRSDEDWQRLKKVYGFNSDKEALAYTDNPIDDLGALARAKVPILHMIGLQDKVVPYSENTMVLVNRYIQLGGRTTVVACSKAKQGSEGHHIILESPRYVADFIKYHSLKNIALDASNYHELSGGLQNSRIQFERNKKGRIAFLGGSITYNGGWRDSLMTYFKNRFPNTEFEFIAAGIPSMGSTPSAFRLVRDVLSAGKVDLLFVEAAVNDSGNGRTDEEQQRAMEGVVRHYRAANPLGDVVMMHFVDPGKMESYRKGVEPKVIQNHNKIAKGYRISTINLAKEVTDRIDHGEFTWENDFKNLHPSPFGQGVYAQSIITLLNRAYTGHIDADDKLTAYQMPAKIDPQCYDNGTLVDVSRFKLSKGWSMDASWTPKDGAGTRANYIAVPMLIGDKPGTTISAKFKGIAVGIAVAAGPDAGTILYRIDKGPWKKQDLFTRWSQNLHLPWYYTLATGLPNKAHKIEIRISDEHNEQSKGNACRIRYLFVNL